MATIKELRLKIRSLQNTNKITTAMKLVATSKLGRAQEKMRKNRPYNEKLTEVILRAIRGIQTIHPLLQKRNITTTRFYVFSSDKGLCGSFNNALIKKGRESIYKKIVSGKTVEIHCIGQKAWVAFRKDFKGQVFLHENITAAPTFDAIKPLADQAIKDFLENKCDEVILLFNTFQTVLTQVPTKQRILPLLLPHQKINNTATEYIYEPDADTLLNNILPKMITTAFYQALLENAAGEHGSRMSAMDNATKNSADLIDTNTILMNRARQAAITTELSEIVAGAESL